MPYHPKHFAAWKRLGSSPLSMSTFNLVRSAGLTKSRAIFCSNSLIRRSPLLIRALAKSVTCCHFSSSSRKQEAGDHQEESFEEFTARCGSSLSCWSFALDQRSCPLATAFLPSVAHLLDQRLTHMDPYRYEKEFEGVQDVFELQVASTHDLSFMCSWV